MRQEVALVADEAALAREGAKRVAAILRHVIDTQGSCAFVLAGGHTPTALYQALAVEPDIAWADVQIFWGDERAVPPDDALSNYRMARESLLSRVPVPAAQVHRIRGEDPPEETAAAYDALLRRLFRGLPQFDLVLLGMGEDGHVASLFPGHPALHETRKLVVPVIGEHIDPPRITLTLPALNGAERVMLLVSGARKTEALRLALSGGPASLPVQWVRPRGSLLWLLDAAAGSRLSRDTLNAQVRQDV